MRLRIVLCALLVILPGCVSTTEPSRGEMGAAAQPNLLTEKAFVFETLRYAYRWHFDQSYFLEEGNEGELEIWSRRIHPRLDSGDRSDYAEMWIPAIKTEVQLKRSEYAVPELRLSINERTFKVRRVTRQKEPEARRSAYRVERFPLSEVKDYLYATRTNSVPISDALRQSARKLVADYLDHAYPEPFKVDQIGYMAPLSAVSNELWFFWETGRKLLFFSADADLTNPGFAELSRLRLQVIDLDKDIVASTREVPGSNAFVTKDWVGRVLFNCILYGERVVRTPEQVRRLRSE